MSNDISIIILTLNEEKHLPRLLESLSPLEARIVIVDSGSTDATKEIAEKFGCDFYLNDWVNYAKQFQWGLDNCGIATSWVMRMDADEYLEGDIASEILEYTKASHSQVKGFYIKRKVFYKGKWIRHGGHYPQVLLRIWRSGEAHIEQRWMDEHIVFDDPTAEVVDLDGHIVDDNLNDSVWWIEKHNKYASREAVDSILSESIGCVENVNISSGRQAAIKRYIKNNIYKKMPIAIRSTLYFFYRYIFRMGFLDGKEGFFYHFMQGYWYRTLVDLRIFEYKQYLDGGGEDGPIKFFGLKDN